LRLTQIKPRKYCGAESGLWRFLLFHLSLHASSPILELPARAFEGIIDSKS
jgi:hypothetical protein